MMKTFTTFLAVLLLTCLSSTSALADGDSMGGGGKTVQNSIAQQ